MRVPEAVAGPTVVSRRDGGRAAVTRGTPAWPRETSRFPGRYWDEYPPMVRLRERFHELAKITLRRSRAPGGSTQPAALPLQGSPQTWLLHPPITVLLAVDEHNRHAIAVLRGKLRVEIDVLFGQRSAFFGRYPLDDETGVFAKMTARTCEESHRMGTTPAGPVHRRARPGAVAAGPRPPRRRYPYPWLGGRTHKGANGNQRLTKRQPPAERPDAPCPGLCTAVPRRKRSWSGT